MNPIDFESDLGPDKSRNPDSNGRSVLVELTKDKGLRCAWHWQEIYAIRQSAVACACDVVLKVASESDNFTLSTVRHSAVACARDVVLKVASESDNLTLSTVTH